MSELSVTMIVGIPIGIPIGFLFGYFLAMMSTSPVPADLVRIPLIIIINSSSTYAFAAMTTLMFIVRIFHWIKISIVSFTCRIWKAVVLITQTRV